MAGAKKPNSKLGRTFVSRLARELANDSESSFSLADNPQALKEALQAFAKTLPPGTSRSSLQLVLEEDKRQESLISALQIELRAFSAIRELHDDVLLTFSASENLFQALVRWTDVRTEISVTDPLEKLPLAQDEVQLLLARDPSVHILWALAAVELDFAGCESEDLGSALFHRLKPWLVNRNKSFAIAAIAPLLPLIFKSLQKDSKDVRRLKTFRSLVKEVFGFIVAVNYKKRFTKSFDKSHSKEILSFQGVLDGFHTVLKAFELQGTSTLTKTPPLEDQLNNMFPLASEVARKILKPPNIQVGLLADIVKAEFLLLYMLIEVLYWRRKSNSGDKLVKGDIGFLRELAGRIGVFDLTAGQTDLLLDLLLLDLSSFNVLLDDKEKSRVCISIFKALLLYRNACFEKSIAETLSKNKRSLEGFVKRVAVVRKFASEKRTKYDVLEAVACHIPVPPNVVDCLKSAKMHTILSMKEIVNDRALIGWLIQASDTDFQSFIKEIMKSDLQADESVNLGKVDVGSREDSALTQKVHSQAEIEELFFLDTTGEEKAQDMSISIRQGKTSKKRKAKQVILCRQEHVTNGRGNLSLGESSNASSDSEASQNDVRERKRNGNESALPPLADNE